MATYYLILMLYEEKIDFVPLRSRRTGLPNTGGYCYMITAMFPLLLDRAITGRVMLCGNFHNSAQKAPVLEAVRNFISGYFIYSMCNTKDTEKTEKSAELEKICLKLLKALGLQTNTPYNEALFLENVLTAIDKEYNCYKLINPLKSLMQSQITAEVRCSNESCDLHEWNGEKNKMIIYPWIIRIPYFLPISKKRWQKGTVFENSSGETLVDYLSQLNFAVRFHAFKCDCGHPLLEVKNACWNHLPPYLIFHCLNIKKNPKDPVMTFSHNLEFNYRCDDRHCLIIENIPRMASDQNVNLTLCKHQLIAKSVIQCNNSATPDHACCVYFDRECDDQHLIDNNDYNIGFQGYTKNGINEMVNYMSNTGLLIYKWTQYPETDDFPKIDELLSRKKGKKD